MFPLVLFAVCVSVNESLGFGCAEFVFSHWGSLNLWKERWPEQGSNKTNLLTYVSKFRKCLHKGHAFANETYKDTTGYEEVL